MKLDMQMGCPIILQKSRIQVQAVEDPIRRKFRSGIMMEVDPKQKQKLNRKKKYAQQRATLASTN